MPLPDPSTWLLFAVSAAALVASPGPDFFYVLSHGMAQGKRAGVLSAIGISLGLLVHTTLAALGLSVLLKTSALAFNVVKYGGAAYLLWMGWRMLRDSSRPEGQDLPSLPDAALVRQGLLTNVFNPKAALTFLAFLPQFVHPERGGAAFQIVALGLTIITIATLWFSTVGAFAGIFGAWIARHPRTSNWVQRASGALMIALGVRLAFVSRF